MSDKGQSRRDLLVGARRLALGGVIAPILSSGISGTAEADAQSNDGVSAEQRTEATAEKVINALEGAYGRHPGQRRNHTKGVGALGSFVGNREAAVYSRSELFSGTRLEVVARFSLAGGDPESSDAEKSPRGMALEFRMSNGGLHHMTMIHTPMFFAAVPQTFLAARGSTNHFQAAARLHGEQQSWTDGSALRHKACPSRPTRPGTARNRAATRE
jgi:catalase